VRRSARRRLPLRRTERSVEPQAGDSAAEEKEGGDADRGESEPVEPSEREWQRCERDGDASQEQDCGQSARAGKPGVSSEGAACFELLVHAEAEESAAHPCCADRAYARDCKEHEADSGDEDPTVQVQDAAPP